MPTLNDLQAGQAAVIGDINDPDVAIQALRIGIFTGESIVCVAKIPAGPTVIQRGGMELAIGQQLCQQIQVELS